MENQTCFNLNQALVAWRADLASQPGISTDNVREFESHLLDSMSGLQLKGLSEEEAFWLSKRRLGSVEKISAEMVKSNPATVWAERVIWMVAGILGVNLCLSLSTLLFRSFIPTMPRYGQMTFWMVGVYFLIASLALLLARGRFSGIIQMLEPTFKSRRGVALAMTLLVLFQAYGAMSHIGNMLQRQGLGYSHNNWFMDIGVPMLLNAIWPVLLCCILILLLKRSKAASNELKTASH